MKIQNKRHSSRGFTLIELVIVIVIIGILAAVAVTKYSDLTGSAKTAAMQGNAATVQSAFAIYLAANAGAFPTVTQLTDQIQAGGATVVAAATGVQFTVSGTDYTVATYTDSACTTATAAVGNTVQCVGTYS